MNFKIALAALLIMSGGSFVSNAQSKSTTVKAVKVNAAKAFENKIAAYEKETDASKSAALLSEMKKEMNDGMVSFKTEIADASAKGDTKTVNRLLQNNDTRTITLREVMKGENKASIVIALKRYAQTL